MEELGRQALELLIKIREVDCDKYRCSKCILGGETGLCFEASCIVDEVEAHEG